MSFPCYPKYKDSGVEWLGEVPEGWEIISIKWLSPVKRGASPRPIDDPKYFDDKGEFAWVRIADVSACDGILNKTTQRLSDIGSSLSVKIMPGELFVSIAGTVGKPCISAINACIHDGFVYFPDLKIAPRFLYRIFEAGICYGGLGKWGTQLNLNTDTIGSIRIGLPSVVELNRILAFLDRETAKIDELVAEQQRLIELLKEKRQAVISHAVTKGLNPDAPMKDSGVEWLGEVPEHWEVKCIKHIVAQESNAMVDGPFGSSVNTQTDYVDEGVPVVRTTNITNAGFSADDLKLMRREKFEELRRHSIAPGDVLFSKVGTIGNSCLLPDTVPEAILSTTGSCKITVANEMIAPYFLVLVIKAMNAELMQIASANVQPFLNMATIKNLKLPSPPRDEQDEILARIEVRTKKLDELIAEAKRAIDLLQERRTALISAAVTGQIDVRNYENERATA